jgi:molecular chaperone HscB
MSMPKESELAIHPGVTVQSSAPTDYFFFLGLPRKLNIDMPALERKMFSLSRKFHPDLFARATVEKQEWALEQSSRLNDAYRTLRDPIRRTEYLLRIENAEPQTAEPTNGKKAAVPPDLLEEVFELNMQLEEFRADRDDTGLRAELSSAQGNLEEKLSSIGTEMKRCWDEWDALITKQTCDEKERRRVLDSMSNLLNRRKYLDNLVREISVALQG